MGASSSKAPTASTRKCADMKDGAPMSNTFKELYRKYLEMYIKSYITKATKADKENTADKDVERLLVFTASLHYIATYLYAKKTFQQVTIRDFLPTEASEWAEPEMKFMSNMKGFFPFITTKWQGLASLETEDAAKDSTILRLYLNKEKNEKSTTYNMGGFIWEVTEILDAHQFVYDCSKNAEKMEPTTFDEKQAGFMNAAMTEALKLFMKDDFTSKQLVCSGNMKPFKESQQFVWRDYASVLVQSMGDWKTRSALFQSENRANVFNISGQKVEKYPQELLNPLSANLDKLIIALNSMATSDDKGAIISSVKNAYKEYSEFKAYFDKLGGDWKNALVNVLGNKIESSNNNTSLNNVKNLFIKNNVVLQNSLFNSESTARVPFTHALYFYLLNDSAVVNKRNELKSANPPMKPGQCPTSLQSPQNPNPNLKCVNVYKQLEFKFQVEYKNKDSHFNVESFARFDEAMKELSMNAQRIQSTVKGGRKRRATKKERAKRGGGSSRRSSSGSKGGSSRRSSSRSKGGSNSSTNRTSCLSRISLVAR
jgi:hypothetical protein